MRVIDMHTHIFPRQVARKATAAVADYFGRPEPPRYDGTAEELSNLLTRTGIDYALVFSAATTPHQVEAIDRYIWSEAVKEPRFLPCGTLHAGYENYRTELAWMREHGIHGIKLHPEFQHFPLDDERLFPMFEEMEREDMFLIAHMGSPKADVSGPAHMLRVAGTFPRLRCICAHLGNWGDWDIEKIRPLTRLPNVYTDISSTFNYTADHAALYAIIREYDPTHIFYGSDYPIWRPEKELRRARELYLPEELLEDVLFNNFARFYHYRAL